MTHLLELSGDDVAQLTDTDLRSLVAKVCEAQIEQLGLPLSAVTWGGRQTAPDGGLDVRVRLPPETVVGGVVPRANTGYQVKLSDMQPMAIRKEMRPGGALRQSIRELADQGGCYIMVSAASTSESSLRRRIAAMREAVSDHPNAAALEVQFYDRQRIAQWVKEHPQVVPWLRDRLGKPMQGWFAYGSWPSGPGIGEEYFVDDASRIVDRRRIYEEPLTVVAGLERIRAALSRPNSCVRLTGLSGTGKTRLVQALFDARVGSHPLVPSRSVYCDFARIPTPSPAEMIGQLKVRGEPIVVIVDNCPPDAHRMLTEQCCQPAGTVSLLTIEFDVADDLPEETQVFKLEPASEQVIEKLLAQRMSPVSEVDRRRIAILSGGNARIALALCANVEGYGSISHLSDRELFKRLFEQRQGPADNLLRTGEVASLVYSFNADTSSIANPEVTALAKLAGMSEGDFFRSIKTLRDRDLVQDRGVWRALLPQALADRLAREALASIPQATLQQAFTAPETPRLFTSFTRRLGSLHDSEVAQAVAISWLAPGGRLGSCQSATLARPTQFLNIAPVVPESTLAALQRWVDGPHGDEFVAARALNRGIYVTVLGALAYDAALFLRAGWLLALFAEQEPRSQRHNGARRALGQLFRLVLSGTHASVDQRLALVNRLTSASSENLQQLSLDARDDLMSDGPFMSFSSHAFGSRSRDYGWMPKSADDVRDWRRSVLLEAAEIGTSRHPLAPQVRKIIAKNLLILWRSGLEAEIEEVSASISRQMCWPDGWIAVRKLLGDSEEPIASAEKDRLEAIEKLLQPRGPLQTARAYIFSQPWSSLDIADDVLSAGGAHEAVESHAQADKRTEDLGRELSDSVDLEALLDELVAGEAHRARPFGKGLARGAMDVRKLWNKLKAAIERAPGTPDGSVLGGFIVGAAERDIAGTHELLDAAASHPIMSAWLPWLQASIASDERGLARLEASIATGATVASAYRCLAYGRFGDPLSAGRLSSIVLGIAQLPNGLSVAADILQMRFFSDNQAKREHAPELLQCGRTLLRLCDFKEYDQHLDYILGELVKACLKEPDAADDVRAISEAFFRDGASASAWYAYEQLVWALFETRPYECLDMFFGSGDVHRLEQVLMLRPLRKRGLDLLSQEVVLEWARREPAVRFPIVAMAVRPIRGNEEETTATSPEWSETALGILEAAPDRLAVLEAFATQFVPSSWSGSRAVIIENRRTLLSRFLQSPDPRMATWARAEDSRLAVLAEHERSQEKQRNQSFE